MAMCNTARRMHVAALHAVAGPWCVVFTPVVLSMARLPKLLIHDPHQAPKVIGSSGKILKSGPNDRVFVYYADHGAPGARAPDHSFVTLPNPSASSARAC